MSDLQLMHIKAPRDMYRAVKRQMHRQNKTMSAIVREALAAWLEQHGDVVDATVAWGGYRENDDASRNA